MTKLVEKWQNQKYKNTLYSFENSSQFQLEKVSFKVLKKQKNEKNIVLEFTSMKIIFQFAKIWKKN